MTTRALPDGEDRACRSELVVDSVALVRLIDEVRDNRTTSPTAYNRMHNRHNR